MTKQKGRIPRFAPLRGRLGIGATAFPLGGRWVSAARPDEGGLAFNMVPFGEETPCVEHLFRLSSFGTFP